MQHKPEPASRLTGKHKHGENVLSYSKLVVSEMVLAGKLHHPADGLAPEYLCIC